MAFNKSWDCAVPEKSKIKSFTTSKIQENFDWLRSNFLFGGERGFLKMFSDPSPRHFRQFSACFKSHMTSQANKCQVDNDNVIAIYCILRNFELKNNLH
jgi:hypothetical protein